MGTSEWDKSAFHTGRPDRLAARAEVILRDLRRPRFLDRLKANLGRDRAHQVFNDLSAALLSDRPILTSGDLAQAVADELRMHNFPVNASRTGILSRTLSAVSKASNFKFNAEYAARQAK